MNETGDRIQMKGRRRSLKRDQAGVRVGTESVRFGERAAETALLPSSWKRALDALTALLVPLGIVPLGATFVQYAYHVGIAAAFAIPISMVKADANATYSLLLLLIPVALFLLIVGVGAQPTMVFERATKSANRKHPPLWASLLVRAYLVLVYSYALAYFFEPLQRQTQFIVVMAISGAFFIVVQVAMLLLENVLRSRARRAGEVVQPRDYVMRYAMPLGVAGFMCFLCAVAYSVGFRQPKTTGWYYVLPGARPEITLLMEGDGYVTAGYRPRPATLYGTFRWHEWKEHRAMDLLYTGVLHRMTMLRTDDPQVLVEERSAAAGEH